MILAAGTGGCIALEGDESPTPTKASAPATSSPASALSGSPTPQPTRAAPRADVAFIKTTDRSEGVRRALDLLGIKPAGGKTVLFKPNFNSADPAPGSTHNDILRTLGESLWEMGARSITVAEIEHRSGCGTLSLSARRPHQG